jgi:sigma-B regulation protein RsbU (phosphoserine phosphatase)
MVGMDEDAEFPSQNQSVQDGDRLFVFSDGVFEIEQADSGEMWTFQEFVDFMSRPPNGGVEKMDELLAHVRQLAGCEELTDDFSIVEVVW